MRLHVTEGPVPTFSLSEIMGGLASMVAAFVVLGAFVGFVAVAAVVTARWTRGRTGRDKVVAWTWIAALVLCLVACAGSCGVWDVSQTWLDMLPWCVAITLLVGALWLAWSKGMRAIVDKRKMATAALYVCASVVACAALAVFVQQVTK